ncbi:MAG: hypothetical protein J6A54_05045 [Clostridia bacterium]|nr:hypothetical protein [Clostridia bacterium]
MKIDKNTINMLLKMSDDRLWSTLKFAMSRSGNDIMKDLKQPEDLSKLREVLAGLTDDDIDRVSELLEKGKKK